MACTSGGRFPWARLKPRSTGRANANVATGRRELSLPHSQKLLVAGSSTYRMY